MINLIPKAEKKKKVKEFYYKLLTLFLFMMSLSFLIVFVAILPSYILSSTKGQIIDDKLRAQGSELQTLPDQETLSIIKDLNNKLDIVERAENNKFLISQKIINSIVLKKMPSIKITDISYENDPVKGKKVSIQGNASSREDLLLFSRTLEDEVSFSQVDLPISNFIRGSNIKFYLSLIPA